MALWNWTSKHVGTGLGVAGITLRSKKLSKSPVRAGTVRPRTETERTHRPELFIQDFQQSGNFESS